MASKKQPKKMTKTPAPAAKSGLTAGQKNCHLLYRQQ